MGIIVLPMSETNVLKQIQLAFSKQGHRLFRCNTGLGWTGRILRFSSPMMVKIMPGDIVIRNARPLHAGLVDGGADGIGWTKDGRFLAVEIKSSTGRATEAQINFITAVNRAGGFGFIARSVDEAVSIIKERYGY